MLISVIVTAIRLVFSADDAIHDVVLQRRGRPVCLPRPIEARLPETGAEASRPTIIAAYLYRRDRAAKKTIAAKFFCSGWADGKMLDRRNAPPISPTPLHDLESYSGNTGVDQLPTDDKFG
jgi:hypothetical protein